MRNLINNFLYGQTSKLLMGNPANEISINGCEKFDNMVTYVQGGCRRRPPLKYLTSFTSKPIKIIPFVINVSTSFVVIFLETEIKIYSMQLGTVTTLNYPASYGTITPSTYKDLDSAVYYNSLFVVNSEHPLLKIDYTGVTASPFIVSLPQVKCNQDNKPVSDVGYGQDDFLDSNLNKSVGNYPSRIAVMKERLWLACTNNDPYTFWASRPYATTQKITPKKSNDSILDFTQYQIVETTSDVIDESEFPVSIQYYSDGKVIYEGISTNQVMWKEPTSDITTKKELEVWEASNSLTVTMRTETGHIAEINEIYHKVSGADVLYIYYDSDNNNYRYTDTGAKSSTDPVLTVIMFQDGELYGQFKNGGTVLAVAKPKYSIDLSSSSSIFTKKTTNDLVATESTAMENQLASGRNDKITWMGLGSYIIIGTECSEWILDQDINPLNGSASIYSHFGSEKGFNCRLGSDTVFISRGNKLKLLYKDYYGLQNKDASITCPELMEGEIIDIASKETDEPTIYVLKNDSLISINLDRDNKVQSFSKWYSSNKTYLSIAVVDYNGTQKLIALVKEVESGVDKYYLNYFDFTETTVFKDCKGTTNSIDNYTSILTTNGFDVNTEDGSTTIGYKKLVDNVIIRAYKTGKVIFYTDERNKNITQNEISVDSVGDFKMNVNGANTTELHVTVQAYEGEPMNILALAYNLKVGK